MPDTKRKKSKHGTKNDHSKKRRTAESSRIKNRIGSTAIESSLSLHGKAATVAKMQRTPLQYVFGSIPLSSSSFTSSSFTSSSARKHFQSASNLKLRRSARLRSTTETDPAGNTSVTKILSDDAMTQKWFITPASSTIKHNIPQLKDASHSHASLSSSTTSIQQLSGHLTFSTNPPSSTLSAITQSTLQSGNNNTNLSYSGTCWSSSIIAQDDLPADCEQIAYECRSQIDDHESEHKHSERKRMKAVVSSSSSSSICTRQRSAARRALVQNIKRKGKDGRQSSKDAAIAKEQAKSHLFTGHATPNVLYLSNPKLMVDLPDISSSSSTCSGYGSDSGSRGVPFQSSAKKKRHRYRLRSLSWQSEDEFSCDNIGDNDTHEFLDMDDLSNLILTAKESGTAKIYCQPSGFSQSCMNDSALTCAYVASYGTLYHQSLLERENLQLEKSKKRLEGNSTNQQNCGDNNASDLDGCNKLKASNQRMMTRSFCKIGEKMNTLPSDVECNVEKSQGSKDSSSKSNKGAETYEGCNTKAHPEKSMSVYPRYMQVGKQKHITVDMRTTLVDWIIDVTMEFKLSHDTLHYCVCLIDRCLEEIVVTKNTFHCLGCACLMIASKLIETKHPRAADISFFTNNACTVKDISTMEREITKVLQFHLQFVTSFHFTERFLNASHLQIRDEKKGKRTKALGIAQYSYVPNPKLECMLMYFIDMSLLIPELVDTKKSLVVASALYLARGVIGIRDSENDGCFWSDALTHYTGYSAEELVSTVTILHKYQRKQLEKNTRKRDALTKKYVKKEFLEVAKKATILFGDLKLHRKH